MALTIKRDKPKEPLFISTPETRTRLLCGHAESSLTKEGVCWKCDARRLRRLWYPTSYEINQKENTMALTMKKPGVVAEKKEVATPAKKAAVTEVKKVTKVATPKVQGKTLHLNVSGTWAHLFKSAASKKMTDAQITEFMMKEFPERKSETFKAVGHWRRIYNQGKMTEGKVPSPLSVAYEPTAPKAAAKK